jgi:hypothetical protein
MNFRGDCWAIALAALLLAGAAAADPAPGRVSLHWAAPDECPDDVELVHQIEALLGQSLLEAGEQSLSVHASAQGSPEKGYAAKVSFRSPQGTDERYLEHPSCESLVQALALVVALAIDPERVRAIQRSREAASEALALPAQAARSAPMPAQPVAPPLAPRPERQAAPPATAQSVSPLRGVRLAVHGLVGAGQLPRLGSGLEATLGWHRQAFRAELVGRYWLPRAQSVPNSPSVSLELGLDSLGVRGCWLPTAGAFQIAACAGGDLADMSGRGSASGLQNPHTPHALYADLSAGFEVAYTRSHLAPEAGFEISGAASRPPFGIGENGLGREVFKPEAWGFNVFLGLAFEL